MAFVAMSIALKKISEAEPYDRGAGKEAVDMFNMIVGLRRYNFQTCVCTDMCSQASVPFAVAGQNMHARIGNCIKDGWDGRLQHGHQKTFSTCCSAQLYRKSRVRKCK